MQDNTRISRLLGHAKAYAPKVLKRHPSPSEGAEGDIQIGNTSQGIKLYVKVGNIWYPFSPDSTSQGSSSGKLHIMHGGWEYASNSTNYLPFRTPDSTASDFDTSIDTSGGDNEDLCYMFPFSGAIKKIMLRSDGTPGETVLTIYKAANGESEPPGDGLQVAESETIDMAVDDTAYTFDFGGARISAGEIIAIKCNPASVWGSVMYTIVIEYD